MKLSTAVLSVMRRGAMGGAVMLAVGCSTQATPIHREPAARLAPVVVAAPVPAPVPAATIVPLPAPPTAPEPTTPDVVAVADTPANQADGGAARRRHHRRDLASLFGTTTGVTTGDQFGTIGGTLDPAGIGSRDEHAGCGRG